MNTDKFFYCLLIAIGSITTIASGLCSLFFLIDFSSDGFLIVLLVGGIPMALGILLWMAGCEIRDLRKERKPLKQDTPNHTTNE